MIKDPSKVSSDMVACTKNQKIWLKEHGQFGETYADVLQRLIDFWDEYHDIVMKDKQLSKGHQTFSDGKIEKNL